MRLTTASVQNRQSIAETSGVSFAEPEPCEALDKSAIADLSAGLIDEMTRDELVRVIISADVPVLRHTDVREHLAFFDRETLTRLAHLARQCCQNQGRRSVV